MTTPSLSPDAQSALSVCQRLISALYIGGDAGRKQFESTLHPSGHMAHARYARQSGIIFHRLLLELADYVSDAWSNPGMLNEVIDGQPTVLVDHDIAMVWTPYWFRNNGKLSHVGTNCFNLIKVYESGGASEKGKWEWKIVTACDTARLPTGEEMARLDAEYSKK